MAQTTAEASVSEDRSLRLLVGAESGDESHWRQPLAAALADLVERFQADEPVTALVTSRASQVDHVATELWAAHLGSAELPVSLVATGGYGRGELHPYSDVDLMVLVAEPPGEALEHRIAGFFAALWDAGLDIGHSVRTCNECASLARDDITIATALMESRMLAGDAQLYKTMAQQIEPTKVWPADEFFREKRAEQKARHQRFENTAYQLEPNVKGGPGGLRDIQMIGWVAMRHFGITRLDDLVQRGFLSDGQLRVLNEGRAFLWRVRFALHVLTGRREDRLLFDHQANLAGMLGYEDASYTLAVEQLMQRYYRTVMDLSRLNEMLLQLFEEILLLDTKALAEPVNARFEVKNGYLQTVDDEVFARDPSALLELFLLLQQRDDIRGVSAWTVGLIRRNLHLIDEGFRQDPKNHRLFLSILRAPAGVTHELRRMNLYGVLGLYIPAFGRIVGRMQYDLFHAYTVDQHTLFVVSNLRRFALKRFDDAHPRCSALMQSFKKPEVIYLAGLFHDIAKGRGGDHSELGAVDAESFCLEQGFGSYDARIVAWLVRHHLALSMTAQKKDLGDPDVINEFASLVGDRTHLDYLYVLTVADVSATNPRLWNSWKDMLFADLYDKTLRALNRGLENPIDRDLVIDETRGAAKQLVTGDGSSVPAAWNLFPDEYFLRFRVREIAWHTAALSNAPLDSEAGHCDVRKQSDGDGIEAMLYVPGKRPTFAHATAVLAELGTTIMDVRIVPLTNGYSLNSFVVMEIDPRIETDDERLAKIKLALTNVLKAGATPDPVTRPAPRRVRAFTTPTEVRFGTDESRGRTIVELVAADRPGLLSVIGQVFVANGVDVAAAKVLTIGERAEDVFFVVDQNNKPLDDSLCNRLHKELIENIDRNLHQEVSN